MSKTFTLDRSAIVRDLKDVRSFARMNRDIDYIDVRLQADDAGSFILHTGDPSYDTDHSGYWGSSSVTHDASESELLEIAGELADEAEDHFGQEND